MANLIWTYTYKTRGLGLEYRYEFYNDGTIFDVYDVDYVPLKTKRDKIDKSQIPANRKQEIINNCPNALKTTISNMII